MPVRRLMEGRSPEDLVRLKQEGQLGTAPVTRKDLMDALGRARPTVSVKESQRFDEWAREFASG